MKYYHAVRGALRGQADLRFEGCLEDVGSYVMKGSYKLLIATMALAITSTTGNISETEAFEVGISVQKSRHAGAWSSLSERANEVGALTP